MKIRPIAINTYACKYVRTTISYWHYRVASVQGNSGKVRELIQWSVKP